MISVFLWSVWRTLPAILTGVALVLTRISSLGVCLPFCFGWFGAYFFFGVLALEKDRKRQKRFFHKM